LVRYGKATDCTKNSAVGSAVASATDWTLVFPGFAVHHCTTTLDSTLSEIDNAIRVLIGEEWEEEDHGKDVWNEQLLSILTSSFSDLPKDKTCWT
jgi:hypothetical protein